MFKNLLGDSTFMIFNSFFSTYQEKNFIIDPFTCMVRLAVLSFKPVGTKISIFDNMIKYNDPSLFQGTIRWSNGDNRNDLHNLYGPIKKAIKWDDLTDQVIYSIFSCSCTGINILKSSYINNSTIYHSLVLYEKIITESLKGIKPKESDDDDDKNKIYTELKNLWNDNEIEIINNLIKEMKKKDKKEQQFLIDAIDSIISIKENKVRLIIFENTKLMK